MSGLPFVHSFINIAQQTPTPIILLNFETIGYKNTVFPSRKLIKREKIDLKISNVVDWVLSMLILAQRVFGDSYFVYAATIPQNHKHGKSFSLFSSFCKMPFWLFLMTVFEDWYFIVIDIHNSFYACICLMLQKPLI